MAGKVELFKDKAGEFRFRLKAGNGETIATGELQDQGERAQRHRVGQEERLRRQGRGSHRLALSAPGEQPFAIRMLAVRTCAD